MFDLGNAEKNQLLDSHSENKYYATDYEIDINDKNNTKTIISGYIKENSTCLDVGCGAGYLGNILNKYKKAKVYGIDIDSEALMVAKKINCFKDLYNFSITDHSGQDYHRFIETKKKFDYIIFADVLEHVISADQILTFFAKYLKPDGELIVSLPNIAHFDIIRGLANQKFNYNHIGLLDNTHLRFYTKSSFYEFIEQINQIYQTNFSIKEIGKTIITPNYISQYPRIYELLNQDNEACVLQYVYAISLKGNQEKSIAQKSYFDELENRLSEIYPLRARVVELELAIDNIYKSKSWAISRPIRGVSKILKNSLSSKTTPKEINLETDALKLVRYLRFYGVRTAIVTSTESVTEEWLDILSSQKCHNILINVNAGLSTPILKKRGFTIVAMIDEEHQSNSETTEKERNINFYADYLIFKNEKTKNIFQDKFDPTGIKTKIMPWELNRKTAKEIAECFKKKDSVITTDLSVIIPNYNYEKYLPMRINSIVEQTVKPKEIILLDDCSKDNSLAIAKPLLAAAKARYGIEYRIIKNETNLGCFTQWCRGFKEAKCPFVWISEADDYARPNFIETIIPSFEDEKVVISYCKSCRINSDSIVDNYDFNWYIEELDQEKWTRDFVDGEAKFVKKYLSDRNSIPNASATIIRKSATLNIDKELSKFQTIGDWFAYIYIITQGKVHYHADVLNGFRRHDQSIIAKEEQSPRFIKEKKMIQEYLTKNL